jgi:hypothetical protein
LVRSPKFGDGITSETVEESGVKILMFVLVRGSGKARCRFESDPSEVDEPSGMIDSNWTGQRQ